jgi:methionine synthase I (cobalamin-dependent)/5,10-methylenetetrahydrofolate reductase
VLKQYLDDNILITDGAMGTYYSHLTGAHTTLSELANIENPQIIKGIHQQYIDAGAMLIRTNTFSTNSYTLNRTRKEVATLITGGYDIAKASVGAKDVFIAADIGPIPEMIEGKAIEKAAIQDEYLFIIDTFLKLGANIFVFETFSSTEYLKPLSDYIKSSNPESFVLAQFALNAEGYTRKGISARRIQEQVKEISSVDAYGFNCGVGPAHLHKIVGELDFSGDRVSILPNSGYPVIVNERTVYTENPEYFADRLMDIRDLGANIIGGCCGTTPLHISMLARRLDSSPGRSVTVPKTPVEEAHTPKTHPNSFAHKLNRGEFVVAVELNPPFSTNLDKVLEGAGELKDRGVDILTVADSPMARTRIDSGMVAAKIKREVGIDTMPHLCCRDRNVIAIKSWLLGAYIEGIRNLLVITGDPVPSPERNDTKSVFNLNSIRLLEMIAEMNREVFAQEPYFLGGALNLNVLNKDVELRRMEEKIESGARFFLTQPVFLDSTIEYLEKAKERTDSKILAGIIPLVSYRNAVFLNNEIAGIDIPDKFIKRFSPHMSRLEAEDLGVEIAVDMINRVKDLVDGIYLITPFNRTGMIAKIIDKSLRQVERSPS